MFSVLAVGYLFLGSAGAAPSRMRRSLDLAWVGAPFGHASRIGIGEAIPLEPHGSRQHRSPGSRRSRSALLFLTVRPRRIDRVASLLLRPSLSFLTVGTYACAGGLAACAALW